MAWIEIAFELLKIIFIFCLGVLFAIWMYKDDYNQAVDDAYDIGYLKGKEEAECERTPKTSI